MSVQKIKKRTKVKPFVKFVNYNHIMPTRYTVGSELDLKKIVDEATMANGDSRKKAKKAIKEALETTYHNQAAIKSEKNKNGFKYFMEKLRF